MNEKKNKKGIVKIIFDVVFWVCFVFLVVIWVIDFVKVQQKSEPVFCISEKTHEFEDGTVDECTGLGYKVFIYKRKSIEAYQFGPFFIKMKE